MGETFSTVKYGLVFRDDHSESANSARWCPRRSRSGRSSRRTAMLALPRSAGPCVIVRTARPYWIGVLATDGISLAASCWLSCQLVYDFVPPAVSALQFWREISVVLALQLGCLTWRNQCRGLLSYFSFPELRQVGTALGLATLCLLAWWAAGAGSPPRNFILVDFLLSVSLLSGFRVLLRRWHERSAGEEDASVDPPSRVGIIGAGSTGAKLALELIAKKKFGRVIVAFFDDDS